MEEKMKEWLDGHRGWVGFAALVMIFYWLVGKKE